MGICSKKRLVLFFKEPLLLPLEPSPSRGVLGKVLITIPIRNFPWEATLRSSHSLEKTFLWLISKLIITGTLRKEELSILLVLAVANDTLFNLTKSSIDFVSSKSWKKKLLKSSFIWKTSRRIYFGYQPQIRLFKRHRPSSKPAEPRIIGVGYRDKGNLPENTVSWRDVSSHLGTEEGIPKRKLDLFESYTLDLNLLSGKFPFRGTEPTEESRKDETGETVESIYCSRRSSHSDYSSGDF